MAHPVHYQVKLHKMLTIRFQATDSFLSQSKVKVKCHQNLNISIIHHSMDSNHVTSIADQQFLPRDGFVGTNRRAIAMMFVHLSVCLRRVCIVIIR